MSPNRPHYEPPKAARRAVSNITLTEFLLVLGIVCVLTAVLYPLVQAASVNGPRQLSCLSNGKQLSVAVMMYSQDYDEHLPLAKTWYDATYPYYKNKTLVCPQRPSSGGIGYAMDERLSGRSLEKIGAPHDTRPLLYESSNFTPNAHDPETSFAGRHKDQRGWVGFVDGHVKMFQKATYPACK